MPAEPVHHAACTRADTSPMPTEPIRPFRADTDTGLTPAQRIHPARTRADSSPMPMSRQGV